MVTATDIRWRQRAELVRRDLRENARPELDILGDIRRDAEQRTRLYRQLAEHGPDTFTRETVAALSRRLDFLYEELRIARMVTA